MSSEQVAAIERLRELEKKATPGEWVVDEAKRTFNLTKIYAPSDFVGSNFINKDADLICALRNDGMPLIEALQQSLSEAQADARVFSGSYNALAVDFGRLKEENERLLAGIKDVAAKFAEMTDLRNHYYYEMETAQTEVVFAKREIERLRAGIGRALGELEAGKPGDAESILEALHDA